eukprot:CAMPEP_0170238110 /NCGR_PEP_ID=MMETSP0116_2-20130129/18809_1 /TAXON_ID=400756 /ORGANISM="Durinskia baltica, Strain CSIRO CS-38" /LENGTH=126 /DNA_ID=CAMNT_0010488921 /DNA_START=31 /DNA_END=409 /DNA_ORIENTATION=+
MPEVQEPPGCLVGDLLLATSAASSAVAAFTSFCGVQRSQVTAYFHGRNASATPALKLTGHGTIYLRRVGRGGLSIGKLHEAAVAKAVQFAPRRGRGDAELFRLVEQGHALPPIAARHETPEGALVA